MTGTEIINAALTELGVIAPGNDPSSEDSTFVLGKLNRLLDRWATKRLFVFAIGHSSYPFASSKQSYTIGPVASTPDFVATRPVKIDKANVVLVSSTPSVHKHLTIINTSDYASLSVPALASTFPSRLYYQPTLTKGTLWPWPYPQDTSNELELFSWIQLAQISTVGSDYALPPGYADAIIYSLAESLASSYGKQVSPELVIAARLSRSDIASINSQIPNLDCSMSMASNISGGWSKSAFLSGGTT